MFSYIDEITRELTEQKYWQLPNDTISANSSAVIINCVYKRLLILRRSWIEVFEPPGPSSSIDGPAGRTHSRLHSSSPSLVFNTAIGAVLPDETAWKDAYVADPTCRIILDLIANPSLMAKANLSKIHSSYRSPLRRGLIILQKNMLVIKEPIKHESVYRCLQIVPRDLQNIVLLPFVPTQLAAILALTRLSSAYACISSGLDSTRIARK